MPSLHACPVLHSTCCVWLRIPSTYQVWQLHKQPDTNQCLTCKSIEPWSGLRASSRPRSCTEFRPDNSLSPHLDPKPCTGTHAAPLSTRRQDARGQGLCGQQLFQRPGPHRILFPHHGWAGGPCGHGCENGRDRVHEPAPHEGPGGSGGALRWHGKQPHCIHVQVPCMRSCKAAPPGSDPWEQARHLAARQMVSV